MGAPQPSKPGVENTNCAELTSAASTSDQERRSIEPISTATEHARSAESSDVDSPTVKRLVEARTRELSTLLEVTRNVNSTLELQPLLRVILDQFRAVVE